MKVKICGLSTTEQVETSIKYGADFCGFILNYPKSHRFIEFEKAKELTEIEKKILNMLEYWLIQKKMNWKNFQG